MKTWIVENQFGFMLGRPITSNLSYIEADGKIISKETNIECQENCCRIFCTRKLSAHIWAV